MSTAVEKARDSRWDSRALIWSAALVPVPIVAFYASRSAGLTIAASEDVATLLVMLPLGGPHVVATFMRSFFDGDFRRGERLQTALSWLLYAVVAATAIASVFSGLRLFGFVPMQLLLTGFFFWASFHVLQQSAFCVSSFEAASGANVKVWRWVELAVLYGSLYPFAFFRMSMIDPADPTRANPGALATRLVLASVGDPAVADDYVFRIGRTTPILPGFITSDLLWIGLAVAYLTLVSVYLTHVARQWREGRLEWRRFQLVGLTAGIGFFLPLVPNLDSAFQGMNAWHCAQYLRLSWLMHREKLEAGARPNAFVGWYCQTRSMARFYGSMLAITVAFLVLLFGAAWAIQSASAGHWRMFGVDASELGRDPKTGLLEYRPGSVLIAYYLMGFGFLLIHYLQDSWLFTKQGSLGVKIAEERAGRGYAAARFSIQ